MFKVRKPPPDARILKLRDYEDKLQAMHNKCAEQVCSLRSVAGDMNSTLSQQLRGAYWKAASRRKSQAVWLLCLIQTLKALWCC